jgi:hypothetical protein
MKGILGHSPDFIEGLLYAIDRADNAKLRTKVRKGNWSFYGGGGGGLFSRFTINK